MARPVRPDPAPTVTGPRAARLYRLLTQIADAPRTRPALLRRLRVDQRGFYRDLEMLREMGIGVESDGERYKLVGTLNEALTRLPFPDPGLSLREAVQLAKAGRTEAHRKLQTRINTFIGPNGQHPADN